MVRAILSFAASHVATRAVPVLTLDVVFASLVAACACVKLSTKAFTPAGSSEGGKSSTEATSLRWRFLFVFWLCRMADWLQGPYFYEVYASKVVHGRPVSESLVSKLFLTGFGTSAIFGATIGRLMDLKGRKLGLLAFSFAYMLSALSTRATKLPLLFAGRIAGGIGTLLLAAAPESWLVSEQLRCNHDRQWLSETFAIAYSGDSIIAILAGQLAERVAVKWGPTAPFSASQVFLASGGVLAAITWGENTASREIITNNQDSGRNNVTIKDALYKMCNDPRICCVGAVQALFEGAMYVFVMQWPPALKAIMGRKEVPFGKVFACFMASCMLGSSAFASLVRTHSVETILAGMLAAASSAMATAATRRNSFPAILGSFFLFEACVGIFFPAMGTLRSKFIPDSHRSVIMALFGIPRNIFVIVIMLCSKRLGLKGSLFCSAAALQCAFFAQLHLYATKDRVADAGKRTQLGM